MRAAFTIAVFISAVMSVVALKDFSASVIAFALVNHAVIAFGVLAIVEAIQESRPTVPFDPSRQSREDVVQARIRRTQKSKSAEAASSTDDEAMKFLGGD